MATPRGCASSESSDGNDAATDSDAVSLCLIPSVPRSPDGFQTFVPTSKDVCVAGSLSDSAYAALFKNGAMMGISCGLVVPRKSIPVGTDVPESLRPTALQLTTIHPPWIDRFPFPKMRDNMITLMGIINEEEFLADLFCLTSFTLDPGAASWDPAAWKIGKEFSAKWGYLFY